MGCLFLDLDTDGKEVSGGGVLYLLLTGFFTCVFHSNPSLFLTIIFFPHFTDEETEVLGNYPVSGK